MVDQLFFFITVLPFLIKKIFFVSFNWNRLSFFLKKKKSWLHHYRSINSYLNFYRKLQISFRATTMAIFFLIFISPIKDIRRLRDWIMVFCFFPLFSGHKRYQIIFFRSIIKIKCLALFSVGPYIFNVQNGLEYGKYSYPETFEKNWPVRLY